MKSAALPPPGHILPDARDAEECVSDVWLRLWNAIPPERPRSLAAYITTVTRRLALDKCDYNRAAQRRSDLTVAFEELEAACPPRTARSAPWSSRSSAVCSTTSCAS